MRKVVVSNSVSVDGFYAGPKGEIDWLPNYYILEWVDVGMFLGYVGMMAYNFRKFY
jgi:hypothetical protein